ncbi:MAG: carbon dioxide concentrating mechanism protein CcmL [Pirellulales bacterium]|nr:carbon dioxide concentrating mechanism protein CcmL [Pirellulales bacterium]
MRLGIVIGTVTLNRQHTSLTGGKWRLVTPLDWEDLSRLPQDCTTDLQSFAAELSTEPVTAYDDLHAGVGSLIAFTEGREASAAFHPNVKPIDAYLTAILDRLDVAPLGDLSFS